MECEKIAFRRIVNNLKFYLKMFFFSFQGTLVPKLTLGPFLTMSVRNGHILKAWVFGIPAHIQSKSRLKNYNQHFIKHEEDKNS